MILGKISINKAKSTWKGWVCNKQGIN